jgi:hypothetical protein
MPNKLTSGTVLWTVTDSAGNLIAQEAERWTGSDGSSTTITVDENTDGIDAYINTCINGNLPVYSHNGGDLYCTYTVYAPAEITFEAGWPAPPPPPKRYTMTLGNLRQYVRWTVLDDFYGGSRPGPNIPAHLTVRRCKATTPGWFDCHLSWRKGPYSFVGDIYLGSINPRTGQFRAGMDVVRTNIRTRQRKRIHAN